MDYKKHIQKFDIVSKDQQVVPFIPNKFQSIFLDEMSGKDVILKSRQIGFSSIILAIFTLDFLTKENSRSVCISQDKIIAQILLDRVKYFIKSAELKGLGVELQYNSRKELVNSVKKSTFYIGTAGNENFGRGDTLTNLHLSEFAYYDNAESILSSVLQAVVPGGKVIIESTANGMNYFKTFWEKSKIGETGFKTHFFDNSFYSPKFLAERKQAIGDLQFKQEYPTNDLEAFISTGTPFFDRDAIAYYLKNIKLPIHTFNSYHDLLI